MDDSWKCNGQPTPYAVLCGLKKGTYSIAGYIESEGLDDDDYNQLCDKAVELNGIEDVNHEDINYFDEPTLDGTYVITTSFNPSNTNAAIKAINGVALKMIEIKYPTTYLEHNGVDTSICVNQTQQI